MDLSGIWHCAATKQRQVKKYSDFKYPHFDNTLAQEQWPALQNWDTPDLIWSALVTFWRPGFTESFRVLNSGALEQVQLPACARRGGCCSTGARGGPPVGGSRRTFPNTSLDLGSGSVNLGNTQFTPSLTPQSNIQWGAPTWTWVCMHPPILRSNPWVFATFQIQNLPVVSHHTSNNSITYFSKHCPGELKFSKTSLGYFPLFQWDPQVFAKILIIPLSQSISYFFQFTLDFITFSTFHSLTQTLLSVHGLCEFG